MTHIPLPTWLWLLLLTLVLVLPGGCKSHRIARTHTQQQNTSQYEGLTHRHTHVQWLDTLLSSWQKHLQGHITLWSAPNETGQQYKQAEMQFQANQQSEDLRTSLLQVTDTLHLRQAGQETTHEEASHHQEATLQATGNNWGRLLILLTLALAAWFYHRRRGSG
ncbi:MAG: hypothetical protein LUG98_09570 [Tannerellaceae bacterium]|nr:hypothetical protein [Tannerellaceae bacterium]